MQAAFGERRNPIQIKACYSEIIIKLVRNPCSAVKNVMSCILRLATGSGMGMGSGNGKVF
jgi:hypothetical protein